jgi:hypothetical protein
VGGTPAVFSRGTSRIKQGDYTKAILKAEVNTPTSLNERTASATTDN